ncbi:hypothetical protein DL93DRAFT_2099493 [Clavulina sp. PMI_390]|nr:hypothetical protein DL93DRAFT_2099493 [Clavulina sp. PMI_390]
MALCEYLFVRVGLGGTLSSDEMDRRQPRKSKGHRTNRDSSPEIDQHSSLAPLSGVPIPDLISRLPTELLFSIVDALSEASPTLSPSQSLLHLSTVNRLLNQITNRNLWRTFTIGPHKRKDRSLQSDPAQIRKAMKERCLAVSRDSVRSSLVVDLRISLSAPVASQVKALQKALTALPNLQILRIQVIRDAQIPTPVMWKLTTMLGSEQFPFHLHTFICEPTLFPHSSASLFRFLHSQPSIETLIVSSARYGSESGWSLSPPPAELPNMFPNLRYLYAPTSFTPILIQPRTPLPLEYAHVISRDPRWELQGATWGLQPEDSTGPKFARVTSIFLESINWCSPLWLLPRVPLLLQGYGIYAPLVRQLRIGPLQGTNPLQTTAIEALRSIATGGENRVLSYLTGLDSIEIFNKKTVAQEFHDTLLGSVGSPSFGLVQPPSDLVSFLQLCEVDCPTLSKIAIKEDLFKGGAPLESFRYHPDWKTPSPAAGSAERPCASRGLSLQRVRLGRSDAPTTSAVSSYPSSATVQSSLLNLPSGTIWEVFSCLDRRA